MSQETFRQLLEQYVSGELSSPGKELLSEMINDPVYSDTLGEFVREILISDDFGEIHSPFIKAKIDAYLDEQIKDCAVVVPMTRKRTWPRIAVAAAVLILVGYGGYFLFFNRHTREVANVETQDKRFKNDILPGSNKAILTLANGSQVILDSAHNGTLALQGNTKIVKTDSGKLTYDLLNEKPTKVVYNVLTTPRGGQYQLTLPDGSQVWLNAASSIRYPTAFTGKERTVEISGEAYFEVAKDKSKPFHVKVSDMEVEVLGTHFNINSYDDEDAIKTTLLEGSVKITVAASFDRQPKNESELGSVELKPGQQAVAVSSERQPKSSSGGKAVHSLTVNSKPDIGQVMAWKNGLFNFEGADLKKVMRQLSRWYDIDVKYKGDVSLQTFHGEITRDLNLSQVLKLLEDVEVKFYIEGKTLTVTP